MPDFGGDLSALEQVLAAGPDVLAHNIETVPRLYAGVRPGRRTSVRSRSSPRAARSGERLQVRTDARPGGDPAGGPRGAGGSPRRGLRRGDAGPVPATLERPSARRRTTWLPRPSPPCDGGRWPWAFERAWQGRWCEVPIMRKRPWSRGPPASRGGFQRMEIQGYSLPDDLYYTKDHAWVRVEGEPHPRRHHRRDAGSGGSDLVHPGPTGRQELRGRQDPGFSAVGQVGRQDRDADGGHRAGSQHRAHHGSRLAQQQPVR